MFVLNKQCTHQPLSMTILQATLLFCTLWQPSLTEGQRAEREPEFLGPLENHINVIQGRYVNFTCSVNHLSRYKVAWIKEDAKQILSIHNNMVAQNPRVSVTFNGHNTWILHISNVQLNDSGTYTCQVNTEPMKSMVGYLQVVIPPDILINDHDVSEVVEGGTTTFRCNATGVPEPTVLWKREEKRNITLHDGELEKQEAHMFRGETLVLTNVQRTDMGAYLCIANNGVPPPVSKRFMLKVYFHPLVRVLNQSITAPISSDVLIQCHVEAFPQEMNYWTLDNGEKLTPNEKYAMEETAVNDYSLLMKLTIHNLEKKDFGGYVCTSYNSLGKAEGVTRLEESWL